MPFPVVAESAFIPTNSSFVKPACSLNEVNSAACCAVNLTEIPNASFTANIDSVIPAVVTNTSFEAFACAFNSPVRASASS